MLPAVHDSESQVPGSETPGAAMPPTPPAATTWAPPPPTPKPGPAPGIEYAGFWIRFFAYIIDTIPFLIIGWLVFFGPMMSSMVDVMMDIPLPPPGVSIYSPEYQAYQLAVMRQMELAMADFYPLFGLLQIFPIVYFIGFWTWRGQTPGLMLFGLRVARETDGSPPGFARSVLRFVGYWISWIAFFIGFIWVAFDARKQGWHDKLAGTVVVRRSG